MLTANRLKEYISEGLNCDHVEVQGDEGQHFQAVIVSSEFVGKSRIQQH
nr:BolA/IbaG family iron-sulfur metabolism protein [uncultured Marinobacter sp.]